MKTIDGTKKELLKYVANMYYYYLDYKFNNKEESHKTFKSIKFKLKHLLQIDMSTINYIFFNTPLAVKPIKSLYEEYEFYLNL